MAASCRPSHHVNTHQRCFNEIAMRKPVAVITEHFLSQLRRDIPPVQGFELKVGMRHEQIHYRTLEGKIFGNDR